MSRFILRCTPVQLPHQVPTCLAYLPRALDHLVIGSRTSTASGDLSYSQDDFNPGSLTMLKISANNTCAVVQTIDLPTAVTALHVSSSKPTSLAIGSSDGSIRTFTAHGSPPHLALSQTFTPFSERAAITSIRYHPLHPGVLACTLYSGSVYVVRIPGHGLKGAEPRILWTLASHSPSPAWGLSWTPEPRFAPSAPAEVSSGLYTVGDDGNLLTSYWTLLEDVTDPNEMTVENPIFLHSREGITGMAVIPSNSAPSRDVVITAGRDQKLKISHLLTFDPAKNRKTYVETLIRTGPSSRLLGPKLVREFYIPSEKDSLETYDPASLVPEGFKSDDEDYVSDVEDGDQPEDVTGDEEYNPSTDSSYVDPDAGRGDLTDAPLGDIGIGGLENMYFILTGETISGLSMLKAEKARVESEGIDTWTLDCVATFDGHGEERLGAMDVYRADGKIHGASASSTLLDGELSMRVYTWVFEP